MYLPQKYQISLDKKYLSEWLEKDLHRMEEYPIEQIEEPIKIKWIQKKITDYIR